MNIYKAIIFPVFLSCCACAGVQTSSRNDYSYLFDKMNYALTNQQNDAFMKLADGHDINKIEDRHGQRTSLLSSSIIFVNNEIASFLLDIGDDPNIYDLKKYTPLHWAALVGNVEGIRILLEYGANINAENEYGDTPVSIVARNAFSLSNRDYACCLITLLDNGADVYHKNKQGKDTRMLADENAYDEKKIIFSILRQYSELK